MIVANRRSYRGPGVYIGRPTKYGNPFSHLPDTLASTRVGSREEAVTMYSIYADEKLARDPHWLDELRDAETLICWCAPLACHGDILVKLLEKG